VVTVAVTPDGYADAVREGVFVTPAERQMTMSQFLDIIDHKTPTNGVVYIQKQNSNFTDEFRELSDDVDLQMTWATKAFGNHSDSFIMPLLARGLVDILKNKAGVIQAANSS